MVSPFSSYWYNTPLSESLGLQLFFVFGIRRRWRSRTAAQHNNNQRTTYNCFPSLEKRCSLDNIAVVESCSPILASTCKR